MVVFVVMIVIMIVVMIMVVIVIVVMLYRCNFLRISSASYLVYRLVGCLYALLIDVFCAQCVFLLTEPLMHHENKNFQTFFTGLPLFAMATSTWLFKHDIVDLQYHVIVMYHSLGNSVKAIFCESMKCEKFVSIALFV